MNGTLTALKGVSVGHAENKQKNLGCTLVLFDSPLNVACITNGGASTTYNTTTLDLDKNYYQRHGIFLSDGGYVGLDTAAFMSKALQQRNIGWKAGKVAHPALTGAAIRSIFISNYGFDSEMAAHTVLNLSKNPIKSGNVGVGMGAMVGKFSWTENGKCLGMKSGIGSAKVDLGNGAVVYVLTVVNALGNVIHKNGTVLAGNRNDKPQPKFRSFDGMSDFLLHKHMNTTISIIGTNVKLSFVQQDLYKIAKLATHGHIRAIDPVNTSLDGDTIFAFTTSEVDLSLNAVGKQIERGEWWKLQTDIIGQYSADAVRKSIYDACDQAESIKYEDGYGGIIPSAKDY